MTTLSFDQRTGPGSQRTLLLAFVLFCGTTAALAQGLVDDFDRANSSTVGNGWTETETVSPTSVRIASNQLQMSGASAGRDFVSMASPGAYNSVLASNTFLMEWSFNMRQSNPAPTGFTAGRIGVATILAGSSASMHTGNGYAVVLGTPNTSVDPIRLVRYTNGLGGTLTDLIAHGDMNDHYLDIRVTYDPANDTWALYFTDHGSTGPFGDARTALNLAGTAVNSTFTSTPLPYIGMLFNHGTSTSNVARFDNFRVPQDISTSITFAQSSSSVSGMAGSHSIAVQLNIPNPDSDMQADLVLVSGNASRLNGYTGEQLTFPANTGGSVQVDLNIVLDGSCMGNEAFVFALQNLVGGIGTPYIGPHAQHTVTVVDSRSQYVDLLQESFETDGNGSRYSTNASYGVAAAGSYLLRTDAFGFSSAGTLVPSSMHGTHAIGGNNMDAIAPDAEVIIAFNQLDILGVSDLQLGLLVGARASATYDNDALRRDYLFVEANVDGQGWSTVGAFRSMALLGSNNKRLALDSDLSGVGDGTPLTQVMRPFNFPVSVAGEKLDLRIRFRTNDAQEEIFFDNVTVGGTLCRPLYFSAGDGQASDPIWSGRRDGPGGLAVFDRLATMIIQNEHDITLSADAALLDLTIEQGGALTISSDMLQLHGDQLEVGGSLIATSGALGLVGDRPFLMEGSGTVALYDLTVDRPAVVTMNLDTRLDIQGTLQLNAGVFDNRGGVRLVSTQARTGRLGTVHPSASYLGNLTVERYVPGGATNWRLFGSPVAGATIAQWNDDFFTAGFPGSNYPNFYSGGVLWPSIRWYNEAHPGPAVNDGLVGVSNTTHVLTPGQGFAAWSGDNLGGTAAFTVDVTGPPTIASSPFILPMSYTNTGVPATDGWNLVSNPLPSAINFRDIDRGADVQNAYWVFNPATGNNASWSNGLAVNSANGILQSSQAFWLKATGPQVTTDLDERAKVNDQTGGIFGGLEQPNVAMIRMALSSTLNTFSDEALVAFQGNSRSYSAEEDALKFVFAHPAAPQISTLSSDGQIVAINRYGELDSEVAIPVLVKVGVSGTYTVTFSDMHHMNGLNCLVVEDLVTGTTTPVSEGASYSFTMTVEADATVPRLMLRASAPIPFHTTDAACFGAGGAATVEIADGAGEVIWSDAFGNTLLVGENTINTLAAGNYQVSVSGTDAACGTLVHTFTISEPFALEAYLETSQLTCSGTADATIEVLVLGGMAPYTYLWSNGATTAEVAGVEAGTYQVTITDANGCSLQPGALVVNAPAPVSGEIVEPETAVVGQSVQFGSTAPESTEHSWNFGDGNTSTDLAPTHTYGLPGTYTVTLILREGNCERSLETTVTVSVSTGLNDLEVEEVRAYNAGEFLVVLSGLNTELHVQVYDAAGRIKAVQRVPARTPRLEIPTTGWAPGVYFLNASTPWEQWTFTLPVVE